MSNLTNKKLTTKKLIKGLALASMAMSGGMLFAEIAWAKFDIDAGVAAAANPIIAGIEAHWGKGVIMTSGAAALFGEGDGRQRAIRAGMTAGAAGGIGFAFGNWISNSMYNGGFQRFLYWNLPYAKDWISRNIPESSEKEEL